MYQVFYIPLKFETTFDLFVRGFDIGYDKIFDKEMSYCIFLRLNIIALFKAKITHNNMFFSKSLTLLHLHLQLR